MKQVDFFKLERSVQDRFLSSCRGEFDPKPILFRYATRPTGWFWLLLAPLAVAGMWFLFKSGLGDIESGLSRHPQTYIAAYVALAIAFAVGIVQFVAHRAASAALPFVSGFYLFPACLVDATRTVLGVIPISEMKSAAADGNAVVLTFERATFRFPVEAGYADTALSAIKLAQMQCRDELESSARVLLDPLVPPVVVGPFAPERPLVERRPLWMKIRFVAAVAFGLVGVIIFQKRDRMSDEAMFAIAQAKDDIPTYRRYLERGTAHTSEVSRLLLPRVELRNAVAEGTVEAIDRFKESYPASEIDIETEVETARKRAVEAAFNEAAKPATLDSLLAFDEKYPGHHLGEHLAAHRHAIYLRGVDFYKAQMPKGAKTADFAARLVAYSEQAGPEKTADGIRGAFAEVRIRAVPSKNLEKAEALVKKNTYFIGPPSLPSRYLGREAMAPLEERVVKAYAASFAKGFPESVLRFRVGPEMEYTEELPEVDRPTLVISYRIEPSGKNFASAKPRGIYIGLVYFFRVDFLMPEGGKPHEMTHVVARNVPGELVMEHGKNPEGSLEAKIYQRMSEEAFDDLFKRYMSSWLKGDLWAKE